MKPIVLLSSGTHTYENYGIKDFTDRVVYKEMPDYFENGGCLVMIVGYVTDYEDAKRLVSMCDGVGINGGEDIEPKMYGQEKQPYCFDQDPLRDVTDPLLIKAAIELKKPLITFCRGTQMLNVIYGGTLYQDNCIEQGTTFKHFDIRPETYHTADSHEVIVEKDSPLYKIVDKERFMVNSEHHQSIRDLGKGLVVQAKAPDGIIESVYLDTPDTYVRGYQFHAEIAANEPESQLILKDFMKAMEEYKK